jgi:hypothetical protein
MPARTMVALMNYLLTVSRRKARLGLHHGWESRSTERAKLHRRELGEDGEALGERKLLCPSPYFISASRGDFSQIAGGRDWDSGAGPEVGDNQGGHNGVSRYAV